MEDYTESSNAANSYAERAIYEDIIANLDGYGSDASEFQLNQQCFSGIKKELWDEKEDPRLRYIMNDHNYILSERHSCISFDMRQNLIDFVKKNSESASTSTVDTTVEKLIDSVLKLLTKATDYDMVIEKIEETFNTSQVDSIKIQPIADEVIDCKAELVENDLSDKLELNIKAELSLWLKQEDNVEGKPLTECEEKSLLAQENDALSVLNETCNIILCKREEKETSETNNKEPEELAETSDKNNSPSEEIKESDTPVVEVSKILPAEVTETAKPEPSEPKEGNEPHKNITETPLVINELLMFADKLKEDYTNASKSNDFNLETFLALKTKEYKSITSSVLLVETSVQTEKVISKKKLRKINAQDKRHLLESSNDSDSSASSYIDQTLTELEDEYNSRKPYFSELKSRSSSKDGLDSKKSKRTSKYFQSDSDSDDECGKSETSQFNESLCSLSKDETGNSDQRGNDTEKDKDESKTSNSHSQEVSHKVNDKEDPDKSRGKSMNESDKENRSFAVTPEHNSLTKSTDDGFHDKEIERLLNLKGLADPQKNTSLTNNTKTHKSSSKISSKTDSLYAVMQEIDKNSLSDDSQNEDSEQILTEKQFLVKCNENLKQQLLNSASSDSDNFNSDIDNDLIDKSNEHSGDEDEHRLSYVDKFLETLIDNEDNSPANSEVPKVASPPCIELPEQNKTDTDNTLPIKSSMIDRDEFGLKKKENTEKPFDGPLSNDKKQKVTIHEDLIDLSAESSNSDVEELAVKTKEKSQRIKPMLRQDQLESETIYAQKKEAERLRRLEKRNTYLTKMLKCQSESIKEKDLVLDYTLVNKKFIKVHPDIVKHLKPHQRDGVKFMYDSCYGCVDDLKANSGSGCILAHCMGLGKTLQIIALLHTVTTYKELKTSKILVLCPKSTIMNWADEIQRWLGPLDVKSLQIYNFSDTADIYEKINVLRQWSTSSSLKAGCLIMGYEAFRSLVFYHSHKNRAKSTVRIEEIRKSINKFLLRPGADLVVCDEGHIIKNRKSGISLAAAEIVTPKRIILTGTPIQNNLKEYYSMVNFIKPLILGTEKEFANLYANPIKNGQHKDSSKRDIKVMKQRSFVLHKKLSKCVQRKEAELLQSFLPQKFEYVLFIPMSEVQNNLYEYVLEAISKREDPRGRSLITDYTCLRKIWTHPKVLEDAWKNAMAAKNKKEPKKHIAHSDDDQPDDIYDSQTGAISVQRDWWRGLVTETDLESILPSNKLKTMFEIIRMAEENGEKCLIFSAFVAVLNVVEYFFNKINDKQRDLFPFERPENSTGHWINGQDYYRLDGKTNKTLRHEMVKRFNDPQNKRARVFLISAKAGGQGINLIGANRVIILDTSWNPANDQQNIFRIFRLGQKKNCYVYRLIAMGTMEEKVYSRSVTKQAMSFRVVDEQQIDRHYSMAELAELYTMTKPCYKERPVPVFPQDQILANLLLNFPDLVYKYHEHDSLLENKVEQELSEQDKADAWVAYERDLQMNSESREVMDGYHGYPIFGQPNYMGPMGDFDPKNLLQGNYDLSQMDMANRNALGSSLIPNYMVNRNSYLDILNMYKNFSSSLLNDKSRNSRFSANYPMSLAQGMMNNPAMGNTLPSTESHLSALNAFYPFNTLASTNSGFPNIALNTNPMLSHLNLSSSSHNNAERYEQNKNIISVDDNTAQPIRNFPNPMAAFPNDLANISLQPKNRIQNPPAGPATSPVMNSPTHPPLPQTMFNTSIGKDGIPRSVIPKRRPKLSSKPAIMPSGLTSEVSVKSKSKDSLLRSSSPRQSIGPQDTFIKTFEQPMPVNMGIVYPKPMPLPLSPASETNEGTCIMKSGSSMQIIPTHSQLTENVRKKFDNISPNISLTAVRTLPKAIQPEHLPATSNSSHLEGTPSNVRKRRGSPFVMGNDNEKIYSSGNTTPSTTEKSIIPPKVSKY